jgi:hypothetical protein
VVDVSVSNNANLTSLNGFSFTSVVDLRITDNTSLTSLNGLTALTSIEGRLYVERNPALTSLSGLDAVTSVRSLRITSNAALTSLNGLGAINSVEEWLYIGFNEELTSLNGFNALTSTGGNLIIRNNPKFTSLKGIDGLTSVGGDLNIWFNSNLETLNGLEKLSIVGGSLIIDGFGSEDSKLTDYCAIQQLITNGQITESEYSATNNKYNPTYSQMQNNGCSTLSIEKLDANAFSVYPNPTSNFLNLKNTKHYKINKISLFSVLGKNIYEKQEESNSIDFSNFPKGIYFLKIETDKGTALQKIIKQ